MPRQPSASMTHGGGRGHVRVEGLIELQRALREVDRTLPRELRKANKNAAEVVASAARRKAFALGGVAAKTAPSIRAAAEQRAAKIRWGGAKYPFAGGANFGAVHDVPRVTGRGRQVGWNQFATWGGNQFTGGAKDLFIYRTLREAGVVDDLVDAYDREIGDLMRRAFPN